MTDEMIEALEAAKEAHALRRFGQSHDQLDVGRGACNTSETLTAIRAYTESLTKSGLGIRPREATEEMCRAATEKQRLMAEAIWKAMWDAHPDKPDG